MPSERNGRSPATGDCHECGRAVASDANFCPTCGADLHGPGAPGRCAACGEPVAAEDAFCANCGAPRQFGAESSSRTPGDAVNPETQRAFRRRVQDHLDQGWELREDHGNRVVLVDRDIGSVPIHILLLLTTGGVGNLLYGWYHYAELSETRRLTARDGALPSTDLRPPGDDGDPLVALSGYLLGGILSLIGAGIAAVAAGQGALLGAAFGLAFVALGLGLTPPGERRLRRRHGLSRFGRIRTVDHRVTRATERTEAPCVVCGEAFERGVVRRRRDETVLAGVPVRTHAIERNHYCADCARAELFGGSEAGELDVDEAGAETDGIETDGAETDRADRKPSTESPTSTDRERE